MNIELKHKPTQETIAIVTPNNDPDTLIKPTYSDPEFPDLLPELRETYGFYGHLINPESVTNMDLMAACSKLPSFEIVSLDNEGMTASSLPEGVQT